MEYGIIGFDGWAYLAPDEAALQSATYVMTKPCPFCGCSAGPVIMKWRPDGGMDRVTAVFQALVECHKCGALMRVNERTREAAHVGVLEQWNDRRPHTERKKV